ncbi:hypothetical protein ElyMa_000473900 [Elysia marginata]|uniref:Uncharacterized protein n=1 Tax=Elysia marginata TaxID=1093978 RepID=A0AAV4FRU5_9GAST|nr:hypothetical protein ElyMa_000473900 [Elysia marginata]
MAQIARAAQIAKTPCVLQDCPLLDDARLKYWPEPREMNQKLYGSALQLGITAEFIYASDLTIGSTMKNEEEKEDIKCYKINYP